MKIDNHSFQLLKKEEVILENQIPFKAHHRSEAKLSVRALTN